MAQRMMLTEMVSTCVEPIQSREGLVTEMALPPAMRMSKPLQDRRHGQGHDQRRQTEIADAEAVHRADRGGDEKREGNGAEARRVTVERHPTAE